MKRSDFFRSVFAIAGGAVAGTGTTGAIAFRWRRIEATRGPGQVAGGIRGDEPYSHEAHLREHQRISGSAKFGGRDVRMIRPGLL